MGRLTGTDLAWMYGHLKPNYHQLARKDRLWFAFANQAEGRKGHDLIKSTYSDYYRESGDVGCYTDFNIRFTNQQAAEWVLSDIDDSLDYYSTYHPETVIGEEAGTGYVPGGGTGTGTSGGGDDTVKKKSDLTTYIIIGAAAAIIIALVIPWKKK